MKPQTEMFFDLSSPWTCIAFHNFRRWAQANGAPVVWRPFLVGGVFNAVNESVYAGRQDPENPKLRRSFLTYKPEHSQVATYPSGSGPEAQPAE